MCKELSQLANLLVNFGSECALFLTGNVHEIKTICDKFEKISFKFSNRNVMKTYLFVQCIVW